MLEYILDNKEWIFSGAGVTAIVAVGTYFLTRSKNKEEPENIFNVAPYQKKPLVSVYDFLPGFVLKRRFKEERLNSYIKIDVRPRGEVVRLNLGELPDCQIWLQLINHGAFDLDIENIKGELNYNGCRISVRTKDHADVNRHSTNESIFLEGTLTGEQAVHCSKENDSPHISLTLRSRIRTKFCVFKKYSGDLQYLNVNVINRRKI